MKDDWFRVGCININNLPVNKDEDKNGAFFTDTANYQLDILLMQEIGINWSLCKRKDSFQERLNEWYEKGQSCSKMGWNVHDITGNLQQWGGTGILSQGKIKHFVAEGGTDKMELGRWTWSRYRGKGGIMFRAVSIYQPRENTDGQKTVWSQQKRELQNNNDDRNPIDAFKEDFKKELQEWIQMGDQVIVAGDVNQSIFDDDITSIFEQHNMRNVIFEMHDPQNAPKTYFRSSEGRIVDGIWATPGIEALQCGYLEPCDFPGNHSLLWVDISFESALGHDPQMPNTPIARRLRLHDSKTVDRYLNRYEVAVNHLKLCQRQFHLENQTTFGVPLTANQRQEAIAIDVLKTREMKKAEHKCRKLKMGGVSFSDATDGPIKKIDFWAAAIRRRKGCTVRPSLWKRKKKAAKITVRTKDLSIEDMEQELQQARKDYKKAKKDHKNLRLKFLDTLKPKDRKRLKQSEQSREKGRLARSINGKLSSSKVQQLIVNGSVCMEKDTLDRAFVEANYDKMHSSEQTPCMQEPLVTLQYWDTGQKLQERTR